MNAFGKLFALAGLGLTAFSAAALAADPVPVPMQVPVQGPRGPSVMIVSEDADKDTIPRNNRSFNRIQRAVADQLVARGFHVFDETAITMDILPQGGVRRQNVELFQIAKLAKTPIDVIVVFQIYASVRPLLGVRDTFQPFVRIDGRMLRVRGGQDLGGYEFGSDLEFPPLPGTCVNGEPPKECLIESFGDQARLIGSAVGNGLATKLAAYLRADYVPVGPGGPIMGGPGFPIAQAPVEGKICDGMAGTPYVLRIRDFDGTELNRLEEALTSFACYEHHRVVVSQPGLTDYWYETRADQARLTRNLRFTLEYMNLPGNVSVTAGNVIIVEKIPTAPHGVVTFPPGTR